MSTIGFWRRLALGTALVMGTGQLAVAPTAWAESTTYSGHTGDIQPAGSGNTITISDGNYAASSSGGTQTIQGGRVLSGDASDNTLLFTGGTFTDKVSIAGGSGNSGERNTVTISGGTFTQGITYIYGATVVNGATNDNTVNLLLNDLNISGGIFGSYYYGSAPTGNTLNIAAKGIKAGGLGDFQHINFYLPSDIADGDTMLTVTGTANVTGATIGAAALGGVNLDVGNTVTLLTAGTLRGVENGDLANNIAGNTSFLAANSLATDTKYTLGLSVANNAITATVTGKTETAGGDDSGESGGTNGSGGSRKSGSTVTSADRVKSPVETRVASLGIINSSVDMVVGQGFGKAAEAVEQARQEARNGEPGGVAHAFVPFAVLGGNSLRHQSGSHVNTRGMGVSVGFSKEFANRQGKLLIAPFVEYVNGNYDSYQDSGIHADGKSRAWGFGVMARQINDNGFYYEGSLRGGRVKSDYSSQLSRVTHVDYDSSSTYWGAHLGVGKIVDLSHNNSLDCYAKYFYSHQTGDDVTLNINGGLLTDRMNFDSVDSHRLRIGARLTHKVNERNSFYGGLAYQYEFDGDARATYRGDAAPSPSVKGSSGLLELGWQVKPSKDDRMTLDLNVTGWAGKQRGVIGQLGVNWKF